MFVCCSWVSYFSSLWHTWALKRKYSSVYLFLWLNSGKRKGRPLSFDIENVRLCEIKMNRNWGNTSPTGRYLGRRIKDFLFFLSFSPTKDRRVKASDVSPSAHNPICVHFSSSFFNFSKSFNLLHYLSNSAWLLILQLRIRQKNKVLIYFWDRL